MTTLQQIITKCIWKISQESGKNYYMRCYECNGFPERAKEIKCDRYLVSEQYSTTIKEVANNGLSENRT